MGNKPAVGMLVTSFMTCPMKYRVYARKGWDDAKIDVVLEGLDEGLDRFGYLAMVAGFEMDLRGNRFSDGAIRQVRNTLFDHGFSAEKFTILV